MTRLYLSDTSPPVSPGYSANWNVTAQAEPLGMLLTPRDGNGTLSGTATGSGVSGEDVLHQAFVSNPLAAQTISGTIKGQILAREAAAGTNARAQIVVKVVSNDGSTVRGVLYGPDVAALSSEFIVTTGATENRMIPRGGAQAVSAVACQAGDRLMIEIGHRNDGINTGVVRMASEVGATLDLPEDETTGSAAGILAAWIELSHTLVWGNTHSGTLTMSGAGAAVQKPRVTHRGTLTLAGSHVGARKTIRAFAGALTFAGTLARRFVTARTFTGALTFTGLLDAKIAKSLAGALTLVGGMRRTHTQAFAGVLGLIGALARRLIPTPLRYRMGRRLVQMHAFLYGQSASGGPGTLKRDMTPYLLNTFWQRSLNLAGRAAFALPRSSELNSEIVPGVDHLALWRETFDSGPELVFQGKIADSSIIATDVVWQSLDYLSYLQRSRAGYRTLYPEKQIGVEIISPEWLLARNVDRSPLAFIATGTIQNPLGADGVTPIKTNTKFGLMMQDRLFLFYSLAEMAMVNTTNNVVFEITLDPATPTFNFWRNRSANRTDPVLSWPGNLTAFSYAPGYLQYVNDLASVVKKATGGGQEEYQLDATDLSRDAQLTTYRRLQQAVSVSTLAGLASAGTESDQMKAAVNRMLVDSLRLPKMFVAIPRMNEVKPFDGWDLGDNLMVFVQKAGDDDVDEVSQYLRVISVAAAWRPDAGEGVQLYLRGKE